MSSIKYILCAEGSKVVFQSLHLIVDLTAAAEVKHEHLPHHLKMVKQDGWMIQPGDKPRGKERQRVNDQSTLEHYFNFFQA